MKSKKLEKAIEEIQDAGGIVMMPDDQDLPVLSDKEVQQSIDKDEFEERKQQAFKEFDELLGSENFSFGAVSDICYNNGIEMDYIEEYIHGLY